MGDSRRLINSANGVKTMKCALDMNKEHSIWLKILVACVVECLENFKGMRKQDHYFGCQLKHICWTEFC